MPLTQDQIDQLNRDGFLPVHNVLTSLELKAPAHAVGRYRQRGGQISPETRRGRTQGSQGELAEDPVRFNNVRKISQLTKFDSLFKEYSRHPRILDVVTSLIGPDLKIFLDQTLCKPARVGSAKPPHQDSAYWTRIDPPDIVTCWMALDDSTEGNGCMRFIPDRTKRE